jgi:tetratricopeptide (TPR) repeat protein
MHLQRKEPVAEEMLLDIVKQHPELVASYDLLADVQIAQNKFTEAQHTLHRGVEVSAKSPRRQRRLGELAYQNEDLDSAQAAFSAAIEKGRNSVFLAANDFANLARVHLDQGNAKAAAEVISGNRKLLQESPEGKLVVAVVQAQVHARNAQHKEARAGMLEAMQLKKRGARCEPELAMDMVEACVKAGMDEEAAELLAEVARNAHDSTVLLDKAKRIYQEAGKAEQVADILQKSTARVAQLSKEGALLLQKGDLRNGVQKLLQASKEAPHNPRVLMNTAWAILRLVEQEGGSGDMLGNAKCLLDDADHLAPEHPRLAGLQTMLRTIESAVAAQRLAALIKPT